MAVLDPEALDGHTKAATEMDSLGAFGDVAKRPEFVTAAPYLLQLYPGLDVAQAARLANALRVVLAWQAVAISRGPAGIAALAVATPAELASATQRLAPGWLMGDVTAAEIGIARRTLDLIHEAEHDPAVTEALLHVLSGAPDSPESIAIHVASLLHGADCVPCPDPSVCDCAPCAAANGTTETNSMLDTIQETMPIVILPSSPWASAPRAAAPVCKTGSCPVR